MFELTREEKVNLKKISNDGNEVVAKRAEIILMSEDGVPLPTISKTVDIEAKAIKHWQDQFLSKRLGIFPPNVAVAVVPRSLEENSTKTEAQAVNSATVSPDEDKKTREKAPKGMRTKSAAVKSKADKKKQTVEYPTRKEVGLEPTDSLAEAGRKVVGFHFAKMLKHEPGTRLGEDIEELHDMRVATRRLRAAFQVFAPGFSKKATKHLLVGLKQTGRVLGPVRDLDVFMEKLKNYQQSLHEEDQAELQPLLDAWQAKRDEARKKMLVHLDSKAYLQFKRDLLEFVTTEGLGAKPQPKKATPEPYQLRHVAPSLIYSTYANVRAYEVLLANAPISLLHQLRIAFKRLRYTVEYLQEVLGEEAEFVISEIKALQDHLGDLNDADVASAILQEFLAEWESNQLHLSLHQRRSPAQIVAYLKYKIEERHHLLTTFLDAWTRFNSPKFKEKLANAIAVL